MSELLPCPFCGGTPYIEESGGYKSKRTLFGVRESTPTMFGIGCHECYLFMGYFAPREGAIAMWNRRATLGLSMAGENDD